MDSISFSCVASAFRGLHLVFMRCICVSWTPSRFHVLHLHFVDSISFSCAASAFHGLHFVFMRCIHTSCTANVFATRQPVNTTLMLCTATLMLCSEPVWILLRFANH